MFLADAQSFVRAQNIFKYSHYDAELREPAKFIYEYADEYKTLPDVDMVNAKTGAQLQSAADIDPKHFDWFLDEYERFARHKSLETAILASADMLEKGDQENFYKNLHKKGVFVNSNRIIQLSMAHKNKDINKITDAIHACAKHI